MKFEHISIESCKSLSKFNLVEFQDSFIRFVERFEITGVRWSEPTTISADYFLRLLQDGTYARERRYEGGDENDINEFYCSLLDHGVLWKRKDGSIICTAMPYGDRELISNRFNQMLRSLSYPDTVQLQFLADEYRFRSNGDHMILIYCDSSAKGIYQNVLDEELRDKAIQHSSLGQVRSQLTTSYVRDRFVSEYAKTRAKGICQLCDMPAPFIDKEGKPYLETHHIVWLSRGGEDSVENTVALCPNCHRKMHILNLENDVDKLLKVATNIECPR